MHIVEHRKAKAPPATLAKKRGTSLSGARRVPELWCHEFRQTDVMPDLKRKWILKLWQNHNSIELAAIIGRSKSSARRLLVGDPEAEIFLTAEEVTKATIFIAKHDL